MMAENRPGLHRLVERGRLTADYREHADSMGLERLRIGRHQKEHDVVRASAFGWFTIITRNRYQLGIVAGGS